MGLGSGKLAVSVEIQMVEQALQALDDILEQYLQNRNPKEFRKSLKEILRKPFTDQVRVGRQKRDIVDLFGDALEKQKTYISPAHSANTCL